MPADPKAERLGLREYSRRRGVSLTAVQKAIQSGRLAKSLVRGNPTKRYPEGRVFIDPAVADREWDENTSSSLQREKKRAPAGPPASEPGLFDAGDADASGLPDDKGDGPSTPSKARAEAMRTHYQAKIARLDWETRVGDLVHADRVRTHAFKIAHAVREGVLQIPDRMAAKVAAADDVEQCRLLLQEACDRALQALTNAVPPMVEPS